jgi:phenylalanyl-tRNA synthetase beta chain
LSVLLTEIPKVSTAKSVSRFPRSDFDLAFSLKDSEPASSLLKVLRQAAGPELVDLALFDVYRAPESVQDAVQDAAQDSANELSPSSAARSLTFRFQLQARDRTLTDAEVSTARQRCIDAATKLGAQFRTV